MSDPTRRQLALEQIRQNIARHGHHLYVVLGANGPRFAYTIGIRQSLGFELILAGAYFYTTDDVLRIVNEIAANLTPQRAGERSLFEVPSCGSFALHPAHSSWATMLMLGALDFYGVDESPAFQIVPDQPHCTVDVPDLREPWSPTTAPPWRWLREPWTYPIPSKSSAITNLAALRGEHITEAVRWEDDEWELFAGAGPDVPKDELRIVPLGILLAADESLVPVVNLAIGEGLWRDAVSDWHPWHKSA
jgi:hypothetical protein